MAPADQETADALLAMRLQEEDAALAAERGIHPADMAMMAEQNGILNGSLPNTLSQSNVTRVFPPARSVLTPTSPTRGRCTDFGIWLWSMYDLIGRSAAKAASAPPVAAAARRSAGAAPSP